MYTTLCIPHQYCVTLVILRDIIIKIKIKKILPNVKPPDRVPALFWNEYSFSLFSFPQISIYSMYKRNTIYSIHTVIHVSLSLFVSFSLGNGVASSTFRLWIYHEMFPNLAGKTVWHRQDILNELKKTSRADEVWRFWKIEQPASEQVSSVAKTRREELSWRIYNT